MDPWRLILDPPKGGAENMAMDEALVRTMEEGQLSGAAQIPVLRIYSWSEPTISIGYKQSAGAFTDTKAGALKLPLVRRITGGRAVLHDTELTYSIACPGNNPLFVLGIEGAYRLVSSAIVDALKGFGIEASFERGEVSRAQRSEQEKEACFFTTSRYEVMVRAKGGEGRLKIAGSSQRRFKGAFLQHGSILLNLDRKLMEKVFGARAVENTTSVNELTEVDTDEFKGAFIERMAEALDADLLLTRVSPPEFCLMQDLLRERYLMPAWNERGPDRD